ncbi:hypothetical protein FUAX_23260 [Fulvitalea axinellae]|uniref:Porin n=1 Tax=Fulvitalea axinellae TaxID=1182444 RepID=A0AAU9CTX0_9BACT|nr:hypothetical protein FUAX_23260 [Fulvitalea axinellae]
MKKIFYLAIAVMLNFVAVDLFAQADSLAGFSVTGSVDLYYQYNSTGKPVEVSSFTSRHNSFELGMVNVIMEKSWAKGGLVVDLAFGPRATAANGYEGSSLEMIKQLYVYHQITDNIKLSAGNFSTFVGYELIEPTGNMNYTTSLLFSNGPFYHTGVKADFDLGGGFGLMAGVFNDTDSKFDLNDNKHVGAQFSIAPADEWSLYLNYLGGTADTETADVSEHQFDITGAVNVSEEFALGLNASQKWSEVTMLTEANKDSEKYSWYGVAGYASYAFGDAFTLAGRLEYFDDSDMQTIYDGMEKGGSATLYTLSGNVNFGPVRLIPEIRYISSDQKIFPGSGEKMEDGSFSALLALVYSF